MDQTLKEITSYIEEYKRMHLGNGTELNSLLRDITVRLHYLETLRADYRNDYENLVHLGVKNGDSVSRSVNEANVKVPEIYLLRRFMDSSYRVCDAIRTNISFLKSEMSNLKQH